MCMVHKVLPTLYTNLVHTCQIQYVSKVTNITLNIPTPKNIQGMRGEFNNILYPPDQIPTPGISSETVALSGR